MKTEFKTKFLQHLLNKRESEGFTLIELLVVIIIIGILSAIALPSFLNQANKAKQSEAKQYVGSINRTQQAYILEKSAFTSDLAALGLGIRSQTENYAYGMVTDVIASSAVSNRAASLKIPIKSYVGVTWLGQTSSTGVSEVTSLAILCEGKDSASTLPAGTSNAIFAPLPARPNTQPNYVCEGPAVAPDVLIPGGTGTPPAWVTIK